MIYFDNSATTKPYNEVLDTFVKVSMEYYGNPSSIHGIGGQAEQLLGQARKSCALILGIKESELIFTSGGTEGNNIAVKGIAFQHGKRGKHIITSSMEHPATFETCKQLEKLGFEITYLPSGPDGKIQIEDVKKAIRDDTILVSILHVNNELGTIQPIEEVASLLEGFPKVFFHVDHVQGLCKVPLSLSKKIDLCSMSGHKIHGVKGTGMLYVRDGVKLFPLVHGGNQENCFRAGTENTPGIVALAKALRITSNKAKEGIPRLEEMRTYLMDELNNIDGVIVNTPNKGGAPHIINFSVPGVKPEVLLHSLEEEDIYVSTKSACSSKERESRILMEAGFGKERASTAIRVSFSFDNTKEEVRTFINVLSTRIKNLKKIMR